MGKKCPTTYLPSILETAEADVLYAELVKLPWSDGIKSKNGFTRKAYVVKQDDKISEKLVLLIGKVLANFKLNLGEKMPSTYELAGIYINYYENGNMYTPNHSHKGTHQLIISLGATRTLTIAKKSLQMSHGDCALFGSSVHGVPKEPAMKSGRISIAAFLVQEK